MIRNLENSCFPNDISRKSEPFNGELIYVYKKMCVILWHGKWILENETASTLLY